MPPVNKKSPNTLRYPTREWLGKFESWFLKFYGSKAFASRSKHLERFLEHFPGYDSLEKFTAVDVKEYVNWRLNNGCYWVAIKVEMSYVRAWFRWLIEQENLPLRQPVERMSVKDFKARYTFVYKAKKSGRSLTDIKVSPFDVWPPVGYLNYDCSAWDQGVPQN